MVETRTFSQIWNTLSHREQNELRNDLLVNAKVADSTIRNWRLGNRTPALAYQDIIVRSMKRTLGIQTKASFLFPDHGRN